MKIKNVTNSNKIATSFLGSVLCLVLSITMVVSISADDTEVIFASGVTNPNVLFIMDNSTSMNEEIVDPVTNVSKTRMQIMQDALSEVLEKAPDNLSVGIMNYGDVKGESDSWRMDLSNGVKFPITQINDLAFPIIENSIKDNAGTPVWYMNNNPKPAETITVRAYLGEIVNSWEAKGNTPIVNALYEASLYFRGKEIKKENKGGYEAAHNRTAAHPSTYYYETLQTFKNKDFPGQEFNYIPNFYNIEECTQSEPDTRTDRELSSHSCVADTGSPNYDPIYPSKATKENCKKIEDDYVNGVAGSSNHCVLKEYHYCKDAEFACLYYGGDSGECVEYDRSNCLSEWLDDLAPDCTRNLCKDPFPAPKYKSPMIGDCQSNFIVLMSDGKPENSFNKPSERAEQIEALTGKTCKDTSPFTFKAGACGSELTHFLAENDNMPDNIVDGDQNIHTYVIGFSKGITANAENYLKSLVTVKDDPNTSNNEGGYFSATNGAELAEAFKTALGNIAQESRSQASPGYSVNIKSGLEHEKEVYIPVFDKNGSSRWSGNLKKFKLVDGQLANGKNHRFIRTKITKAGNADGTGYINAMTELGAFKKAAWDEWSQSDGPDGGAVEKGGAASLLTNPDENDVNGRKLYSNITTNKDLTIQANSIAVKNTALTNNMLGDTGTDSDYRKELINFIRGWQEGKYNPTATPKGIARKHMGDMLHSGPVIITYNKGSTAANKQQYIFAATNEGYLHVFDTETGQEKFAFMPHQLLKNIKRQRTGEGDHIYGIDGSITYIHDDKNKNGNIDSDEKAYLYFGMRRGGRAYYGLDISDIDKPKMLWVIDGETNDDFSRLGQSWSTPYITNVYHDGKKKTAVVFTGGNDPHLDYGKGESYDEDSVTTNRTATMGDNIYIVNALTGTLLWDLKSKVSSSSAITHAIPGGARLLDVNRNGLLDRLYFADTGGNVWRLDLNEDLSGTASDSKLVEFADLSDSGIDARKFYNEPDVAQLSENGKVIYSVSIGSGMRPHPMNRKIKDHMFVLLDKEPLKKVIETGEGKYEPIEFADLASVTITASIVDETATDKIITKTVATSGFESNGKDVKITQTEKRGWYVEFPDVAEKVLAISITFEGSIMFTTLVPKAATAQLINACQSPETQGRVYVMNLLTGKPSLDLDGDGEVDSDDVFKTVTASEIPGSPQQVFGGMTCSNGECTHNVDIRVGKKSTEVGVKNVADIESIYWNDPEL